MAKSFPDIDFRPEHEAVLNRFVAACRADDRVAAAFLGGSYARGAADAFSDLDLYLITTDDDFDSFLQERETFVRRLGEPVFLEDFDIPDIVFYILSDGAEGEIGFGREGQFEHVSQGEYRVLMDKKGILSAVAFPRSQPDPGEQAENLRRLMNWFWHEVSHFVAAMGRGQLWWAQGQLEALRRHCISLARLHHDFTDAVDWDEVYFKLEEAMPVELLEILRSTFCPPDKGEMLEAGFSLCRFYRELAMPLAEAHGLAYPQALERIMMRRLSEIRSSQ